LALAVKLEMSTVVSDRYANFWRYRYLISKKWHGR